MLLIFGTGLHFENEYYAKLDVIQQNISEKKTTTKNQTHNVESMEFPLHLLYTQKQFH